MALVRLIDSCIAELYTRCTDFENKKCDLTTNCGYLTHVFSILMGIDLNMEHTGLLFEEGYAYVVRYRFHTYSWFIENGQIYKLEASEGGFGPTITKITAHEMKKTYNRHLQPKLSRAKINRSVMERNFRERQLYPMDTKISKFVTAKKKMNGSRFLNYELGPACN